MEPRAAIAAYDAKADRWTLTACTQGVMGMRAQLAKEVLRVPPEKVRIISKNVGGSFGMKGSVYPEYVPMLHAARLTGRPVKWANDRSGSFLSDHHGRAQEVEGELALDARGQILAVRVTGFGDMGASLTRFGPLIPTLNYVKNLVGPYRTPMIEISTKMVFTNTAAGRRLSRRRTPRGAIFHGAPHGPRRGRNEHRPHHLAPTQFHQAQGFPLQGGLRPDL